jgi:hypothetical protein
MRIRHAMFVTALGALVAGGVATPAHASFGNCYGRGAATSFSAYCEGSGASIFFAEVTCRFSNATTTKRTGPERFAGQGVWSRAECPSGAMRMAGLEKIVKII